MLIENYGMYHYFAGSMHDERTPPFLRDQVGCENMCDERTPPFLRDEEAWVGLDAANQPDAYSELTDSDFSWRVDDALLPYILDMVA